MCLNVLHFKQVIIGHLGAVLRGESSISEMDSQMVSWNSLTYVMNQMFSNQYNVLKDNVVL